MSDAVLIFTFSPVQSFITEARRASDLYVGSQILVRLARAAAQSIERHQGTLIYPAPPLKDDVPNKLVARVSWEEAEAIAEATKEAMLKEWTKIADSARQQLMNPKHPLPDALWLDIWARQIIHMWETYWAAASLENRLYKDAYDEASRALDAVKHTRVFAAAEEHGVKDTLSGCRAALHTAKAGARDYWAQIGEQVGAAKLRPEGRERLDAIGAVKRFSEIAEARRFPFPSTSTVASADFLARARGQLVGYHEIVEILLDLPPVREDRDWPYDGDLLFLDTLTAQRLKTSYGLPTLDEEWLQEARRALSTLYRQVKLQPSPYYAIIVLDGDSIGQRINTCLAQPNPRQAHEQFSRQLAQFSEQVRATTSSFNGSVIYNGGDDVLALAPLSTAFGLAQALALHFAAVTGGSASAGIAIAHHLFPLGAALQAARQAEWQAKQVSGKDAVCVRTLKRSGETLEMCSPWKALGETFSAVTLLFKGDSQGEPLSTKFAYDVLQVAYALPKADDKWQAELRRLIQRHRNAKHPQAPQPDEWAERLKTWATHLPDQCEELGRWLVFARFVAQVGEE